MSDPKDTKDRILDTAERLFADQGVDATSMRAITHEAGVNLAAINYHFGSKEGLVSAVFGRLFQPVNAERLHRLDELEANAAPELEEVLRAFLRPALKLGTDPETGAACCKLLGRLHSEANDRIRELFLDQFREVAARYLSAFGRLCPHLRPHEVLWRAHFMIGSMAHTMSDLADLKSFSHGTCDPRDLETTTNQLVRFAAAGLRAPTGETAEQTS